MAQIFVGTNYRKRELQKQELQKQGIINSKGWGAESINKNYLGIALAFRKVTFCMQFKPDDIIVGRR